MTSNQAIVYNELQNPRHAKLIREGGEQSLLDIADGLERGADPNELAADWMVRRPFRQMRAM